MNFLSLLGIEFKKIRRSKILFILNIATIILWLPSVFNADLNFQMQAEGISPESNFLIQGLMGMAWFMFPASMVVCTVLLNMRERSNKGILKMLALPINTAKLCLAKFIVLLSLGAFQILMTITMYFISAVVVSQTQNYNFILQPFFVFKEAALIFASAIPIFALFWLLSVCFRPHFLLALVLPIVPSVLMINTSSGLHINGYPSVITAEYGRLASNLTTAQVELFPWIPVAIGITLLFIHFLPSLWEI